MHSHEARKPRTDPLDIDLARAACAGSADAFGALVRMHMERAYIVAYRLLHNREDAQDLVQEAFVMAFENLRSFQPGRPFGPWFFRILVNRGLNLLESQRVRATRDYEIELIADSTSPERDAAEAELLRSLWAAMNEPPPRQRVLVELVELEGFTPAEAAEHLSIAPATARWHLHTARQKLQELLGKFR